MAYPKNVILLAKKMCEGQSPQVVADLLSRSILEPDCKGLKQLAEQISVPITDADIDFLKHGAPTAKSIERWKKRPMALKSPDKVDILAEAEERNQTCHLDQRFYDHWARLGQVAEELFHGMEYNNSKFGINSRFNNDINILGLYSYDPRKSTSLSFSAQKVFLWTRFLEHMDCEFASFSDSFDKYIKDMAQYIKNHIDSSEWKDFPPVWSHPQTIDLRQKLEFVIERGTFKGTCDICEGWVT